MVEAAPSDLVLAVPEEVASARRVTRESLAHPLKHYVDVYGYAERNLKKWLQLGRGKVPVDLPPLDAPADMPGWWGRNMKQKCPQRLLGAAKAAGGVEVPAGGGVAAETAPVAPEVVRTAPMPAAAEGTMQGTGYAAMIERVVHTEQVAWQAWQRALAAMPFNAADEELRRRVYDRASEQARKVLKDREIGLEGDAEWGRWSEFEELAQTNVAVLHQSLRGLWVRVATKLALTPELLRRMVAAGDDELDRVFDALGAVDWRRPIGEEENLELGA